MQQLLLPFFIAIALFATNSQAISQCTDGESTFELVVNTDAWAYEMYYELTPVDVECGVGEELISGGNVDVGCGNTGNGATGYTYANYDSQVTDLICLATNSQVVLHHTDSYGDGGTDFYVLVDGVQTEFLDGSGTGDTWTINVNTDGLVDHDTPCDALELSVDGTSELISNVGATGSYYEVAPPTLGCNNPGGWCEGTANVSVWAKFTVEENIRYQVQLCNTNTDFDSQLALWVNDGCGDWSSYELVGANDDSDCGVGAYYASTAYTPCLPVGAEVYCQIDGWNGATGIAEISVAPSEVEPSISASVNQISCALETEFNPDGSINVVSYYDGLGADVHWTGPFGYTGTGNYIENLLPGVYNVELNSTCSEGPYYASYEIINPEQLELSYTVNSSCENGEGGSVDLEISGGTGEYTIDWDGPNDYDFDGEHLPLVSSGDYNVEVVDEEGCSIDLDIEIPFVGVTPFSLGDDMELCAGDMHIFLAPTGDYTYEWQDGSASSLFILQTEEGVSTTAVIGVSVANSYGCELSDAVVVTVVNCANIEEDQATAWSLFPNPNDGEATLNLKGINSNSLCQIRDTRGRIVLTTQALETTTINASTLEAGVYMVEVVNDRGMVVWHSKAIIK